MSKIDAQRAMREARYEQRAAPATPPAPKNPRWRPAPPPEAQPPAGEADTSDDGLCGHRSISGRTCTRERGHSSKSHRYS
jgi:hypothetical protein